MAALVEIFNPEIPQPIDPVRGLSPDAWGLPVANSECTIHQLSPYIGKLKSSIASDVIANFTAPGDLVADPFCGAGTIPLEANLAGRRCFAADVSPYAYTLTHGKLNAPPDLETALNEINDLLDAATQHPAIDLRTIPVWVRDYFHPKTLKEALAFAEICRQRNHNFALSCLLGILHHQRPGFLSYPSSHLVPYLRSKLFPVERYPELYEYRALRPRIIAKVIRTYKRAGILKGNAHQIVQGELAKISFPDCVDAVVTSPPYMNALDYGRDNRLRLWLLDPSAATNVDNSTPGSLNEFGNLMTTLASKAAGSLKDAGYCVLIVGEAASKGALSRTAATTLDAFLSGGNFTLVQNVSDLIPDIRRARRDCKGIKFENVIVLQRANRRVKKVH